MRASRALQAVGLLFAWASLARVQRVEGVPHAPAALQWLGPLTHPVAAAAVTVVFALLLGWFVVRGGQATMVALAALLAAGAAVQGWQWPGDEGANGAVMLPGAALVAMAVARGMVPPERRDRAGIDAAAGLVAACYLLAGVAKLGGSGWAWTSQANLGVHILAQGYGGLGELEPLRTWVAGSPVVCRALGVGTLVIELGAVAFLRPGLRAVWAIGALFLHVGISLLMGLHHYDWLFTVLAVAVGSRSCRR